MPFERRSAPQPVFRLPKRLKDSIGQPPTEPFRRWKPPDDAKLHFSFDQHTQMPLVQDDRSRAHDEARATHITRLFVIGFAIIEALFIGWALMSTGPR